MKNINLILLIGLSALASGCATKEQTTSYWTEKGGIAEVHHIRRTQTGTIDQTEKLSEKPLTTTQLAALNLPDGHRYYRVTLLDEKTWEKPPAKSTDGLKKKDVPSEKDKLSEVSRKLDDLRSQVKNVVAQNQRLQDQINNASTQQPVEQGSQQQTAQDNPDAPKLSQ
jgi:hypothetical protein